MLMINDYNDNEIHLPDGVRPAEHVVVQYGHLQVNLHLTTFNIFYEKNKARIS